jgi:hypothetical protein
MSGRRETNPPPSHQPPITDRTFRGYSESNNPWISNGPNGGIEFFGPHHAGPTGSSKYQPRHRLCLQPGYGRESSRKEYLQIAPRRDHDTYKPDPPSYRKSLPNPQPPQYPKPPQYSNPPDESQYFNYQVSAFDLPPSYSEATTKPRKPRSKMARLKGLFSRESGESRDPRPERYCSGCHSKLKGGKESRDCGCNFTIPWGRSQR